MGYRCNVACLRQWLSLGVGDRDDRNVAKQLKDRDKFGEIEAAMQCREERHIGALQKGKPKIVNVKMDDIELVCSPCDGFEHRYMRGDGVTGRLVEPQRRRP